MFPTENPRTFFPTPPYGKWSSKLVFQRKLYRSKVSGVKIFKYPPKISFGYLFPTKITNVFWIFRWRWKQKFREEQPQPMIQENICNKLNLDNFPPKRTWFISHRKDDKPRLTDSKDRYPSRGGRYPTAQLTQKYDETDLLHVHTLPAGVGSGEYMYPTLVSSQYSGVGDKGGHTQLL